MNDPGGKRPHSTDATTSLPDSAEAHSEPNPTDQQPASPQTASTDAGWGAETKSDPGRHPAGPVATRAPGDSEAGAGALSPQQLLAGRYRIVRLIGRGGMGEVYEAEDLELKEQVALKTIRPDIARGPRALQRFKREIQLARKVTHPNVCRIFHLERHQRDQAGEIIFLTMELLAGETLGERLKRAGRLTTAEALPLIAQMAAGLEAAHRAGIVHRDFKSGNIVLAPSSQEECGARVVITDFGLARAATGEGASAATLTEGFVGTPAYMAPEQLEGGKVTPATDTYALGVVMYEMATGRPPFAGDTPFSTALKRLKEPAPSPRTLVPDLDPRWEAAILRCLERNPAKRFQSATEIVKVLTGEGRREAAAVGARVARPLAQGRRIAVGLVVAVLALAVLGYRLYVVRRAERSAGTSVSGAGMAGVKLRPAVAVMGFKNLARRPDTAWLSTALSEMFTTELAAGDQLRTVSGEDVARAKIDLALPDAESYAAQTLGKIQQRLHSNYVVLGSYLDLGKEAGGQVRLDVRLQDAAQGETIATVSEAGSETHLIELVSKAGAELRSKLGVGEVTAGEARAVRASLPSNPEAARLYSVGLARLQRLDVLGARDLLEKATTTEPQYPLAHSALAEAWSLLGYSAKAQDEAKKAFDHSPGLAREQQLLVEGRYREVTHDWEKAVEVYRALFQFFPDNLDYGLRLASGQTSAGRANDALRTLEGLRNLPSPARDDARIDLAEVDASDSLGDFKREQAAASRAAEKARSQGARLLLAKALYDEAWALQNLGDLKQAAAAATQSKRIYDAAGDEFGASSAVEIAGTVLLTQGDLTGALQAYQESLGIARKIRNRHGESVLLNQLGNIVYRQGKLAEAKKMYAQVLEIQRELGNKNYSAKAMNNIAGVLYDEGDLAGAAKMYRQSLALSREIGDKDGSGAVLVNLANTLVQQGDLAAAEKAYHDSLRLFSETGNKHGAAEVLSGLGELFKAKDNLAEARHKYMEALMARTKIGEQEALAESQAALAGLSIEEGRAADAEAPLHEAVRLFDQQGFRDEELGAHVVLARALLLQGKKAGAQKEIDRATELVANQERGARLNLLIGAARVRAASGQPADVVEATKSLTSTVAEAAQYGFLGYQFEARLALGEIELRSSHAAQARARLAVLQKDADAKGFGLIARKARDAVSTKRVASAEETH